MRVVIQSPSMGHHTLPHVTSNPLQKTSPYSDPAESPPPLHYKSVNRNLTVEADSVDKPPRRRTVQLRRIFSSNPKQNKMPQALLLLASLLIFSNVARCDFSPTIIADLAKVSDGQLLLTRKNSPAWKRQLTLQAVTRRSSAFQILPPSPLFWLMGLNKLFLIPECKSHTSQVSYLYYPQPCLTSHRSRWPKWSKARSSWDPGWRHWLLEDPTHHWRGDGSESWACFAGVHLGQNPPNIRHDSWLPQCSLWWAVWNPIHRVLLHRSWASYPHWFCVWSHLRCHHRAVVHADSIGKEVWHLQTLDRSDKQEYSRGSRRCCILP